MKLYSAEEIDRIKRILKSLIHQVQRIRLVQFIHFVVIVLFTFIWSNIILEIGILFPEIFTYIVGLIVPIILLISAIKYRSHLAYSIVLSICIFSILLNISFLPSLVDLYLNGSEFELLMNSFCPICEIQKVFRLICISLVSIALLHNKRIVKLYKWKLKSFLKSMLGACILYLIIQGIKASL